MLFDPTCFKPLPSLNNIVVLVLLVVSWYLLAFLLNLSGDDSIFSSVINNLPVYLQSLQTKSRHYVNTDRPVQVQDKQSAGQPAALYHWQGQNTPHSNSHWNTHWDDKRSSFTVEGLKMTSRSFIGVVSFSRNSLPVKMWLLLILKYKEKDGFMSESLFETDQFLKLTSQQMHRFVCGFAWL